MHQRRERHLPHLPRSDMTDPGSLLLIHISPALIFEDIMPSTPAMEPEKPILQDTPAAPVLDLNEDQPQDEQDV